MQIAIGSDHAGFDLKQAVISLLSELGHKYEDFGCYDTGSIDYPDIGHPAGHPDLQYGNRYEHCRQ